MAERKPIEGLGKWPHVSHSSLTDLAFCEKLYALKKVDGHEFEPTVPMRKGSFFHDLWACWWHSGDWSEEATVLAKEWSEANPEADQLPGWMNDAAWLMNRYQQHYDFDRACEVVEVVGHEVPFKVRLPGKYGWLVGYWDALWKIDGKLWVVELKTMADFSELEAFAWSPQITLYHWAAVQMGLEPYGILLDAARTYRWKRDEAKHPPAESFQRRWLDRTVEHDEEAVKDAIAGLERMRALKRGARPLRNVGRHCSSCPARVPCRMQAAFGPEVVIWDDEEETCP